MGGITLLQVNSLPKLLLECFPQYEWLPWRFKYYKCSQSYWENVDNQTKFLKWAGKELNIKEMNGWYNVTVQVPLSICVYCL